MTFSERQKWQKCTDMRGHGRKKYFSPKFNRFLPLNWKIWKKVKIWKKSKFFKNPKFRAKIQYWPRPHYKTVCFSLFLVFFHDFLLSRDFLYFFASCEWCAPKREKSAPQGESPLSFVTREEVAEQIKGVSWRFFCQTSGLFLVAQTRYIIHENSCTFDPLSQSWQSPLFGVFSVFESIFWLTNRLQGHVRQMKRRVWYKNW